MRRLYDKSKLTDSVPAPLSKEEARKAALAYMTSFGGKFQIGLGIFMCALMAIPFVMSGTWLGMIPVIGIFLFIVYQTYDNGYTYNRHLYTYDEIAAHRDEINEFLKERGYIDSK